MVLKAFKNTNNNTRIEQFNLRLDLEFKIKYKIHLLWWFSQVMWWYRVVPSNWMETEQVLYTLIFFFPMPTPDSVLIVFGCEIIIGKCATEGQCLLSKILTYGDIIFSIFFAIVGTNPWEAKNPTSWMIGFPILGGDRSLLTTQKKIQQFL